MHELLEVNWSEGLFLRPHHLQQDGRNRRAMLNEEVMLARPYAYGLHQINISEAELETEVISIRSCNLRMRNGTRLVVPDNAELEPRNFKKTLNEASGSLGVSIGIPLTMDREPNTVMPHEENVAQDRRYMASTIETPDENTGDNVQSIEVRRLSPRILFDGENMAGFETMKVCQIVRAGFAESKPMVSKEFIPPLLDMSAWPSLLESVQDVYHALVAKNRSLAGRIAGRKVAFGSEGVGGPEAMLKLNLTNQYVAFLRQFANIPSLHPFDVYVELCRLAGDLALFDPTRMVPELPLYDHDDLGRCYADLLSLVDKYINNLEPTTFIRKRFEPVGDHLEVALEDSWLTPEVEFFLGIESDHDVDAIDREQSFLKMSSPEELVRLVNRRLPGLMGRRVHRVPIGLPDRPDVHYFMIHREGEYWSGVEAKKTLGCYGLNDRSLALFLYVLLKAKA